MAHLDIREFCVSAPEICEKYRALSVVEKTTEIEIIKVQVRGNVEEMREIQMVLKSSFHDEQEMQEFVENMT